MSRVTFKLVALLGAMAFGVTLALIIGQRLSTEAMAVLMGVIAGIAASIPTSIIVVWIALQSVGRPAPAPAPASRGEPSPANESPRVVVVQQPVPAAPAPPYPQPNWAAAPYPLMPAPAPRSARKFTVIGGGAESEEPLELQPLDLEP